MGLFNVGARAPDGQPGGLANGWQQHCQRQHPWLFAPDRGLQTVQGNSRAQATSAGVDVRTILRNQRVAHPPGGSGRISERGDTVRWQRQPAAGDFQRRPTGLGAAITDMMNAFSDVVAAPTDLSARTLVLTRMDETASRMRTSADRINEIQYTVTEELKNSANTVNSPAKQMAAINEQIARATGNGQTPTTCWTSASRSSAKSTSMCKPRRYRRTTEPLACSSAAASPWCWHHGHRGGGGRLRAGPSSGQVKLLSPAQAPGD